MTSRKTAGIHVAGLLSAAIIAPGLAALFGVIGLSVQEIGPWTNVGTVLRALPGILFILLAATFLGTLQSLAFGGAALLALSAAPIRRTWGALIAAGGVASATYLAASFGLYATLPGAGLLLAPWISGVNEVSPSYLGVVTVSILASGPCAAAIYASVALRG